MKEHGVIAALVRALRARFLRSDPPPPEPAPTGGVARLLGLSPLQLLVPIVVALLLGGFIIYLMFSGPRMFVQPKYLAYQAVLPTVPAEIVPVSGPAALPEAPPARNPLPDTEQTRRAGQVYYGYYCVFCHGKDGRGDGPVGLSYVPTPADLTAAAVRGLSDRALYHASLTGVGHSPVLPYVVVPEAPWYIVLYVRHLPAQSPSQ
jgi:mono/diheme cytochrome c family protein